MTNPNIEGGFIVFGICLFISLDYNFNTGFWFDTPWADSHYYDWHPRVDDSCKELQSKLDLFHPHGINPVRFEILKAMWKNNCKITIDGVILP